MREVSASGAPRANNEVCIVGEQRLHATQVVEGHGEMEGREARGGKAVNEPGEKKEA